MLEEAQRRPRAPGLPAVLARGEDALHRFELLKGLVTRDFVGSGQIISLQGKVEVQRANQSAWEKAQREAAAVQRRLRQDLPPTASAEIIFSDGTVYRVGPDSLLEVHREARGGRQGRHRRRGQGQGRSGQRLHGHQRSTVLTDSTQGRGRPRQPRRRRGADDSSTTVAAYAGRARRHRLQRPERRARHAAGGARRRRREARGAPRRPRPARRSRSPRANALFNLDIVGPGRRCAGGRRRARTAYELQLVPLAAVLTRQPRGRQPPDARPPAPRCKILRAGTYYWRVATLGGEQVRSEW